MELTNPELTISPRQRVLLTVAGLLIVGLLVVARWLTPSPSGLGTHEQLGFSPCWILQQTGVRCPSCGMTTAWAHVVRGEFLAAATANVGGTLAAIFAVIAGPWLLASAVRGRWSVVRPTTTLLLTVASAWLAIVVLDWARRFYTG